MGGGFFMPFFTSNFRKKGKFAEKHFIYRCKQAKIKFSNKRRYQYALCSEFSEFSKLRYGLFVAPQLICKNAKNITVSV